MYIIKIDVSKCEGDGDCVETCPTTIFELQEVEGKKIAVISGNVDDCLGCESCVTICPNEAITLTEA
jgi:NAD-dependent dihydropyrimidine dehydrogenase PreA subunit